MLARFLQLLPVLGAMWLAPIAGGPSFGIVPKDTAKIEAVCRSLLGVEDWRPKEIFARELMPYIRSKHALGESSQVVCSFHCGGTLLLRRGGDVWYGYSNQPTGVMHHIDTVAFHIR